MLDMPTTLATIACYEVIIASMAYAGKKHRGKTSSKGATGLLATPYQQEHQGILIYALLVIAFAIAFHFIEWQTYMNKPAVNDKLFASQNQYYFTVSLIGFAGAFGAQVRGFLTPPWVLDFPGYKGKSTFIKRDVFNPNAFVKQFTIGVLMVAAVQFLFGAILRPFFGSVSQIEKAVFYFTGAISEEMYYRFLIQNTVTGVLRKIPVPIFKKTAFVAGFVAMIPTNIYFMMQHGTAYANEPLLFFGTFFLGLSYSVAYVLSQNIFIPIALHAISNFMVALREVYGFNVMGLTGQVYSAMPIIMAVIIIVSMLAMAAHESKAKRDLVGEEKMLDGIDDETRFKRNNKRWWVVVGIVTAGLFVLSVMANAWQLGIPTAGAP